MGCASSCAERRVAAALLLLALSLPAAAGTLLPLGEEAPLESEIAELGGIAVLGLRSGRSPEWRGRVRGEWGGLALSLAGEEEAGPRGGLRLADAHYALLWGGIAGDWSEPLFAGSRRRGGLGSPSAPQQGRRAAALSIRRCPALAGALLEARRGPWVLRLGGRAPGPVAKAGPRFLATLRRGDWRGEIQRGEATRTLGLSWTGQAAALLWQLTGGERRWAGGRRSGAHWRFALPIEDLHLRGEGLLLEGLLPPASGRGEGWLAAPPGHWLHLALEGASAGWGWLLARRLQVGCGLSADEARAETRIGLAPAAFGSHLRLDLRQIETRRAEPDVGAPGFPRRVEGGALEQEIGLGWDGIWRLRWRRRLGPGRRAQLLSIAAPRPRRIPLDLRMELFEQGLGASPFIIFDGQALYRGVESLSGRGWRLSGALRLGGPVGALRLALELRHADGEALAAKLALEAGVTLR